MAQRDAIIEYFDTFLETESFKDYGPQGLQVEGRPDVNKAVTAVSASLELFERAQKARAEMIIVHHGLLWDAESRVIKGSLKARIKYLLENGMTLLAYHLPLDKHPQIGNNTLAAGALGMTDLDNLNLGVYGRVQDMSFENLLQNVRRVFASDPVFFDFGPQTVRRIGFCSGGGSGELPAAIEAGCDAFISGELKEPAMHMAKEAGIHAIAAGHYATEKMGIIALGERLETQFKVKVSFIDIPNPL